MAIRVAAPGPQVEANAPTHRSFALRSLPTYWASFLPHRRAKQKLENRCERLRQDRMAPLYLASFSEDFWRLSEMIADASRDGIISVAFERDYQLLRLSYSEKWLLLQHSLKDGVEYKQEFAAFIACPTLSEAILGDFWEYYGRIQRAEEVLECLASRLEK
jgi:hypothetical protein